MPDLLLIIQADVEDLTLKYALFSLQGKKVKELVEELCGEKITLEPLQVTVKNIQQVPTYIIKSKRSNEDCFDFLFEGVRYKQLLQYLLEKGRKYNLKKCGPQTYDILRLEAAIPFFGIDFDQKTILSEIGQEAISYTKGCYVGQEVIARIKHRGKGATAKKLVKLEIESEDAFKKNTPIFHNDKEIGFITSSAYSPGLKKVVALGYLKKIFYDTVREVGVGKEKLRGIVESVAA